MPEQIMGTIAEYYRTRHELALKLVQPLDDRALRWRPSGTAPPIAFHVWHMARWADYLQEMIGGLGFQIWEREGLAELWGFEKAILGFAETGLGMADVELASLPFPARDTLLAYASRAFAEAGHAVARVTDDQFHRQVQDRHGAEWEETTIGEAIVSWLAHDSRHLGMIECLIGAQGLHGSATR